MPRLLPISSSARTAGPNWPARSLLWLISSRRRLTRLGVILAAISASRRAISFLIFGFLRFSWAWTLIAEPFLYPALRAASVALPLAASYSAMKRSCLRDRWARLMAAELLPGTGRYAWWLRYVTMPHNTGFVHRARTVSGNLGKLVKKRACCRKKYNLPLSLGPGLMGS